MSSQFRLLRVLNVADIDYSLDFCHQFNLRYIYKPCIGRHDIFRVPSSASLIWNLQTLDAENFRNFEAPPEIWEMPQLRHVMFYEICLPDPTLSDDEFVLGNLQTLKTTVNLRLSDEVCKRIPNVKKLKIKFDGFSGNLCNYCLYNLGLLLQKLESLNCRFDDSPNRVDLLQNVTFPSSLKKLSLSGCRLLWEDLTMIGSLPNLYVLILGHNAVRETEWNPVEGEFLRLKVLVIRYSDLIYWNADSSHFPILENLVLEDLDMLDGIPLGIGEISTLTGIHLSGCSESAAISAVQILEEQESLGNEQLRVEIEFSGEEKLARFREKMEQFESFTSNNLSIS